MWTLPNPPDGFLWRHVGGPDGKGLASLQLAPTGLLAASVMRWGDAWAFLPGPWAPKAIREYRKAPTRGRAMAWAARWAEVHRSTLELLAAGPPGPPGLSGPFLLTPPEPRLPRDQLTPEDAFWRQHYTAKR